MRNIKDIRKDATINHTRSIAALVQSYLLLAQAMDRKTSKRELKEFEEAVLKATEAVESTTNTLVSATVAETIISVHELGKK